MIEKCDDDGVCMGYVWGYDYCCCSAVYCFGGQKGKRLITLTPDGYDYIS